MSDFTTSATLPRTLLVTGATGFIGRALVEKLSHEVDRIYLLVRNPSVFNARKIFRDFPNVAVVEANLLEPSQCGIIDRIALQEIRTRVTDVVHAAALYDLKAAPKELYLNSLLTTQNLVKLCNDLPFLKTFHHLSTYAVNIREEGDVREDDLSDRPSLKEPYSWAKNRSEWVIRKQLAERIRTRVYRPGIVIGDSRTGEIEKWDGPYFLVGALLQVRDLLAKFLKTKRVILPIPYDEKSVLPIIPVDELVFRLGELILQPHPEHRNRTYHLVPENPISFTGLVQWLCRNLDLKVTVLRLPPRLLPTKIEASLFKLLKLPESTGNYLRMNQRFRTDNLRADFPHLVYSHKLQSTSTPWLERALKYRSEKGVSA